MQSVSDALNRLHVDGSWFSRAHEVKLLVVQTSADMRGPALQLLPQFEFHHDNRSGWVLFEDAHTGSDDGWYPRANRLVEHWGQRREGLAKDGVAVRPVAAPPPPARLRATPLKIFRDTSAKVLAELRDPLQGMVFVLAPTVVQSAAAFETDLTEVVGAPELARARFVVVLDATTDLPRRLLDAVSKRAVICNCVVDDGQQAQDMKALLGSADGPTFGMAAPKGVVPPKRVDDPPPLPDAERDAALKEAGVDPRLLVQAPKLRMCVLGAAVAMKEGNGADAVRQQRQARDIASQLGLGDVKVICQITLASYLSGLDQRPLAIDELRDAAEFSREHEMDQQRSEAELALGLMHALDGDRPQAAAAYARAGNAAEAASNEMLAIEAWRLAGQLALDAGQQPQAIQALQRAIALAEGADGEVAALSSGPEAARKLADVCRGRGLQSQATALDEQADRLEAGLEPV